MHPNALHEILDRLRSTAVEPSHRRSLERNAPDSGPELQSGVLAENPDLAEFYRESPEAALDLLRLIREAARQK